MNLSANTQLFYVKSTNSSTTAGRNAINIGGADPYFFGVEAVSFRGNAININNTANGGSIVGSWLHDSNNGITSANTTGINPNISDTIISGNVTAAIATSAGMTSSWQIQNSTLYGAENKLGIGVSLATGTTDMHIINTIIDGFATGVNHADVQSVGVDNYNNYFNNTADNTNWTKGGSDVAVSPAFADVTQITGSAASSATTVLTDATKNFTTAGVVAGRDYLYVTAMTGGSGVGIYDIITVGTTTLTSNLTLGTGSSITYQITRGQNFAPSYVLSNLAFPGIFPGGYTTGYRDIGAAQRRPGLPRGRK
jgi:hypothetical protein